MWLVLQNDHLSSWIRRDTAADKTAAGQGDFNIYCQCHVLWLIFKQITSLPAFEEIKLLTKHMSGQCDNSWIMPKFSNSVYNLFLRGGGGKKSHFLMWNVTVHLICINRAFKYSINCLFGIQPSNSLIFLWLPGCQPLIKILSYI